MHVETKNRKAFEFVADALRDINLYKYSKDPEQLKAAESKLDHAIREDPGYLRPQYYRAMLQDLVGKPSDAVGPLEDLLKEGPPFQDELRYSLGLAYYHQYSWKNLDAAIKHFTELIRHSTNRALKLLAKANLAQASAMHMIPPNPDEPNINSIQEYLSEVKRLYSEVTQEISTARAHHNKEIAKDALTEAEWSIHNALAMSIMYSTDHMDAQKVSRLLGIGENKDKVDLLNVALRELDTAKAITGDNWANHSDLGSCHMRLGHYRQLARDFQMALNYLNQVVERLRPSYGFALYEIGRTYRLQKEFGKAHEYFLRALEVPKDYRDVRDERVGREIDLANASSTKYP